MIVTRSLCDDFVAQLSEFVSDLVRDPQRRTAILICVGCDQTEAALGGLEEETQTADSVDAGPGRESNHETWAGG